MTGLAEPRPSALTAVPGQATGTRQALTLGVEEEFLLVDPRDGRLNPVAQRVLARQQACCPLPVGASVQRELRASQVETATGICSSAAELRRHLVSTRTALAAAAAAEDCAIVATGTPVSGRPARPEPPAEARYREIDEVYRGLTDDYEACGCHIHVGVPDRDTAVAVVNHLSRWLPTLLALSANSPFERGRDTGYHSWRTVLQSRFPGAGMAPFFTGYESYRDAVGRLVDCGVLVDANQTFWLARPSGRFPTVELRVADTALNVDDALLQALLSRALVRTALEALDRGEEAGRLDPQLSAAALWAAARYGMDGNAVDPADGSCLPATRLLTALLDRTHDALEEAGELELVTDLVAAVRRTGTAATRQRAAAADGGPSALHRLLVEQTVPAR